MSTAAILLAVAIDAESGAALALSQHGAGDTVVESELAAIEHASVRDIIVVLGPDAERVIPLVARDNVEPIVDARSAVGEACSLRVGASAVPRGTDVAVFASVAFPTDGTVYVALLNTQSSKKAPIVHLVGRPWPCVVDSEMLAAIRNIPDGTSLDAFLARYAERAVVIEER